MPRLMSTRQYVENLVKEYNKPVSLTRDQKYSLLQEQAVAETREEIAMRSSSREKRMAAYRQFNLNTKKALLEECIYRLYDACLVKVQPAVTFESTCRAIVDRFVTEQGVEDLLRRFETSSEMLSEFALLVNKYHTTIMESVDKDNEETFKVDQSITDRFYDDLDCVNADEVVYSVRNRVANAMNDFIDQNAAEQMEVKQLLQDAKDTMTTLKQDTQIESGLGEKLAEGYATGAKRKISNMRNTKPKSIFHVMVESLLSTAYTNEQYRAVYFEGANPNMDKVIENCTVLYTFLEMVNTAKMIKVDTDYISEVLADMK